MKSLVHPAFLQEGPLKLVFFVGKGGVRKSTYASAATLTLVQEQSQHHILLVSTAPAHSLKNMLSDLVLSNNLKVRELSAAESLRQFKLQT